MYTIATTLGFVIDSKPYREADKILQIFTRDFGLIRCIATGIRLEKSKLRYHIQDLSFGSYSLVKGREFWRLTDAKGIAGSVVNIGRVQAEQNHVLILKSRIAQLLKRFLHGEEQHGDLFNEIYSIIIFLQKKEGDHDNETFMTIESLIVIRILNILGYIGEDIEIKSCFDGSVICDELIESLKSKRKKMNFHINKALNESHL